MSLQKELAAVGLASLFLAGCVTTDGNHASANRDPITGLASGTSALTHGAGETLVVLFGPRGPNFTSLHVLGPDGKRVIHPMWTLLGRWLDVSVNFEREGLGNWYLDTHEAVDRKTYRIGGEDVPASPVKMTLPGDGTIRADGKVFPVTKKIAAELEDRQAAIGSGALGSESNIIQLVRKRVVVSGDRLVWAEQNDDVRVKMAPSEPVPKQ